MSPSGESTETIELLDLHPPEEAIRDVVLAGLAGTPKTLPCKLLYDERGSEIYERICKLPEYYPTRTEHAIMREHVDEMAARLGRRCAVIEYGSGSSIKSRVLLEAMDEPAAYIPIDISREMLMQASEAVNELFPDLEVLPVCADYTQPMAIPDATGERRRRVVYFPGSTIGNFPREAAVSFLNRAADLVGPGGAMLIGVDLIKDRETLEAAYDDAAGVTAEFNLNLLHRLNRELGASFDPRKFNHRAIFNDERSRVEMHLVSECAQDVRVDGRVISFDDGETIHTESSHKFDLEGFAELAGEAGFRVDRVWTDPTRLFSVQYLVVPE